MMENKTPMMQLRERLQSKLNELKSDNVNDYDIGKIMAYKINIKIIDTEMMEIEKEFANNIFNKGCKFQNGENESNDSYNPITGNQKLNKELNFDQYYSQTYLTDKGEEK